MSKFDQKLIKLLEFVDQDFGRSSRDKNIVIKNR